MSENITNKVTLAARLKQEDCPVCFEKFGAEVVPHQLGCCHSVCKECWAHWVSVQGPNAYCPLCRNHDFVAAVVGMHTAPR